MCTKTRGYKANGGGQTDQKEDNKHKKNTIINWIKDFIKEALTWCIIPSGTRIKTIKQFTNKHQFSTLKLKIGNRLNPEESSKTQPISTIGFFR